MKVSWQEFQSGLSLRSAVDYDSLIKILDVRHKQLKNVQKVLNVEALRHVN